MFNKLTNSLVIAAFSLLIFSCEKEGEGELSISLKSQKGYLSTDTVIATGSAIRLGIIAETIKDKDPIIRFNISESLNNGANTTLYSEDVETTRYEHDFDFTLKDSISGNRHRYTFTITNKDGINAQEYLSITVQ